MPAAAAEVQLHRFVRCGLCSVQCVADPIRNVNHVRKKSNTAHHSMHDPGLCAQCGTETDLFQLQSLLHAVCCKHRRTTLTRYKPDTMYSTIQTPYLR
jgi:ferredoxin